MAHTIYFNNLSLFTFFILGNRFTRPAITDP